MDVLFWDSMENFVIGCLKKKAGSLFEKNKKKKPVQFSEKYPEEISGDIFSGIFKGIQDLWKEILEKFVI